MKRITGIRSLVHDAVDWTVDLVELGHESTARSVKRVLSVFVPMEPVELIDDVRRVYTSGVLGSVRAVNRLVKLLLDAGFELAAVREVLGALEAKATAPVPMRSDVTGTGLWLADAATAAINGVMGDTIHQAGNGLDVGMMLRLGDEYLPAGSVDLTERFEAPPTKLAVFVHGLATTEWSWCWGADKYHGAADANFGTLLKRDLGYEPVFARYNTGRHVSENGRLLAERLDELVRAWPGPLEEILLVGHSMGGLVLRSACHHAKLEKMAWVDRVQRVFCLGSPHQGAPLEKLGHLATAVLSGIDTAGTRIPGEILKRRSAGIKDLRHGYIVDDDWIGRDPDAYERGEGTRVPLLEKATYHFISATVTVDPEHPLGQLAGDVLVRVPSASGPRIVEGAFAIETRSYGGVLHHELQNHPDVYALLRRACEGVSPEAKASPT
ncbi:MAG: alpha/beta fold hydrolase [Polyangiaceae bacterium]|nr:alpha/beta fold hydrolase [Polyangiaceae bacterium]